MLNTWDPAFTPVLSMADPGEAPKEGSLLVAPLGEGVYIYTGLALFRQFGDGVPGRLSPVRQPGIARRPDLATVHNAGAGRGRGPMSAPGTEDLELRRIRKIHKQPLAGLLLIAAMLVPAIPTHAQTPVWSATLTVARTNAADAVGYCRGAANCSGETAHYGQLSEPGFSIGEMAYTVTSIRWGAGGEGYIHLTLDQALSDEDVTSLVLRLNDASLSLAEARVNEPAEHDFTANYTWDGSGPVPGEGASVSVSLSKSPPPAR